MRIGVLPVSPCPDQSLPPLRTPSGRMLSCGSNKRESETELFLRSLLDLEETVDCGGTMEACAAAGVSMKPV